MVQGGSAVQMFTGLDARQIKVANASDSAVFDFKAVLDEKTYASSAQQNTVRSSASNETEKSNSNDLMSKRNSEISEAQTQDSNNQLDRVREKVESKELKESESVGSEKETEESKALKAAKQLLKKLGMSDEEISLLMENIPQDQLAELEALMMSMMGMQTDTADLEALQADLSEVIGKMGDLLETVNEQLSTLETVPQELMESLQQLAEKLQSAEQNLSGMDTQTFESALKEVEASLSTASEGTSEGAEVEVVEYKVTEASQQNTPEQVQEGTVTDEAKASEETSEDEGSQDTSKQGSDVQSAQTTNSAEQTPSQVDQSFSEMIKVENTLIRNAQPMEMAAGRARVAQNVMNQVLDGAKLQLNPTENGQQIMLRLRPEELGNVNLKISVEKGILMAEFQVESQVVKQALESNMADLKQALAQKGYSIEGMQVSVGQEQTEQQSQFENQFFSQSRQRKYFFGLDEDLEDIKAVNKTLAGLQSTFEYLG